MARIGMVNYINTAPIYEVWKERIHPARWAACSSFPGWSRNSWTAAW